MKFQNNIPSIRALTNLFNKCLIGGVIPTTWAKGIISLIPKSASNLIRFEVVHVNDPRVPLNYRGISLLPVISKLYSGLILTRVSAFLEVNDLIANEVWNIGIDM